jgi:IS30 family transposase
MSSYTHFSQEERCVLSAYLHDGLSLRTIGKKLQRSAGGLSTEIEKGSLGKGREHYDPFVAQLGSRMRKWNANSRNPMKNEKLQAYVQTQLIEGWSPEIISGRLQDDYPNDPSMQVNH